MTINSEIIQEIVSELKTKAKDKGFRLETEIIQQPRLILDVLAILKFRKDDEVLMISFLGEYGDDIMMIIIAKDEELKERTTLFKMLDEFKVEELLKNVLKKTDVRNCGHLFSCFRIEYFFELICIIKMKFSQADVYLHSRGERI